MANMLFFTMLFIITMSAVAEADKRQLEREKRQDDIHIYVDGGTSSGQCCGTSSSSRGYYPMYYPVAVPMYSYGGLFSLLSRYSYASQQCVGPCVNAQCPAGYTCNANNQCCRAAIGK
ncbi:unnamed protein product [Cylicocyclus nassatus]|uniref:CC domain-containing protein n=1 Tax=Cylicocyclus nassatus TaxID=53992 RepID=A0AA36DJW6_CYLNA|nr:unnamed protein product [Cylicocyclus nassatus]